MPTVSSGSQITTEGSIFGWKMIFFVWVLSSVMMLARPTSEPVPAVVGTAMIGCDAVGVGACPPVADILEIPHGTGLAAHEGQRLAKVEAAATAKGDDAVIVCPRGTALRPSSRFLSTGFGSTVAEDRAAEAGLHHQVERARGDRHALPRPASVTSSGRVRPAALQASPISATRPAPKRMLVG
jgi:hypothetical protein